MDRVVSRIGRRGLRGRRIRSTPRDFQILASTPSFQIATDDVLDALQTDRVVGFHAHEQLAALDRDCALAPGSEPDDTTRIRAFHGELHLAAD
jgi:hypothetical protein